MMTRRSVLKKTSALAAAAWSFPVSGGVEPLVDTHIHLFDPARFPYHPQATYQPPAETLYQYAPEASKIGVTNAILVHPEPYQDDHAYLEYCFAHEPRRGFFKGTCLFDTLKADTPDRMKQLAHKWPGRIVALRIHSTNRTTQLDGPIRDRPLDDPRVANVWKAAGELGMAIQMHAIPMWAPAIRKLAEANPRVRVVVDHLCRRGEGTVIEYDEVLRLGELRNVYMKFSGLSYSSKMDSPHGDLANLIKQIVEAFTAKRIVWGGLGMTLAQYEKQRAAFEFLFRSVKPAERAAIAGGNAKRLFKLKS